MGAGIDEECFEVARLSEPRTKIPHRLVVPETVALSTNMWGIFDLAKFH